MCVLDFLALLTTAGAAARLTRLATADSITQRPRTALLVRVAHPRRLRDQAALGHEIPPPTPVRAWFLELLTCPWCLSVWIAALLVPLALLLGDHPAYLATTSVLAVSYIVGWLADNERE